MIRKISVAAMAAALVAALIGTFTWPGEAQQRAANTRQPAEVAVEAPVVSRHYDAGMRIIHVPQPGATVARYHDEPAAVDDEVETAPPPRQRAVAPQPRRVLPPADSKRTILNPPKSIHDGPTPIRPTPRWRSIEKFTEPPKPVAAAPLPADPVTAPIPAPVGRPAAEAAPPPVSDPDIPAIDDDAPPPAELPPTR